jgi:hypothetical protein
LRYAGRAMTIRSWVLPMGEADNNFTVVHSVSQPPFSRKGSKIRSLIVKYHDYV